MPDDSSGYVLVVRLILDGPGFCLEYPPVHANCVSQLTRPRFLELEGEGRRRQHDLPLRASPRVSYLIVLHGQGIITVVENALKCSMNEEKGRQVMAQESWKTIRLYRYISIRSPSEQGNFAFEISHA